MGSPLEVGGDLDAKARRLLRLLVDPPQRLRAPALAAVEVAASLRTNWCRRYGEGVLNSGRAGCKQNRNWKKSVI